MKFTDERGQNMRGLQIIIVIRPIEVGRHHADEIAAVLAAVGLAHFDAGDFGDGVPLIRRFERASQKMLLFDRLGGEFWVNARTSEEQKLFDAGQMRPMDEVVLNLQVLKKESGRLR